MRLRRNLGFTLVELLIIIGLLGSIMAIAAPNIFGAEKNAKTEACRDQMDFILNGFQTHQFDSKSPYAFDTLTDGEIKLNAYIVKAIDSSEYRTIGFEDQVACPSDTPTAYEASIQDDKLYVYCPTHDAYSHGSLSPRPLKSDPTKYTNLDSWISTDNNWIVGDHESFFVLPIQDQYYHMEIGFQLFTYDDGVNVENQDPVDGVNDPIYEYQHDDPDWYWPIPIKYYDGITNAITSADDQDRPYGYDLDNYNPPKKDLAFALAVDFQIIDGGYNFTSNALELKNINSNAAQDIALDIAKNSEFDPDSTIENSHERQYFDEVTDWLIIDIVPSTTYPGKKSMIVHMLDENNIIQFLFQATIDEADPDEGEIQFAFFMGKRVEDAIIISDDEAETDNIKASKYYAEAFPSPVQVAVKRWIVDYDGIDEATDNTYAYWYENVKYMGYTASHSYMISN